MLSQFTVLFGAAISLIICTTPCENEDSLQTFFKYIACKYIYVLVDGKIYIARLEKMFIQGSAISFNIFNIPCNCGDFFLHFLEKETIETC